MVTIFKDVPWESEKKSFKWQKLKKNASYPIKLKANFLSTEVGILINLLSVVNVYLTQDIFSDMNSLNFWKNSFQDFIFSYLANSFNWTKMLFNELQYFCQFVFSLRKLPSSWEPSLQRANNLITAFIYNYPTLTTN